MASRRLPLLGGRSTEGEYIRDYVYNIYICMCTSTCICIYKNTRVCMCARLEQSVVISYKCREYICGVYDGR